MRALREVGVWGYRTLEALMLSTAALASSAPSKLTKPKPRLEPSSLRITLDDVTLPYFSNSAWNLSSATWVRHLGLAPFRARFCCGV